eukprot:1159929-Pelagomonas_calceolata.AAC.24
MSLHTAKKAGQKGSPSSESTEEHRRWACHTHRLASNQHLGIPTNYLFEKKSIQHANSMQVDVRPGRHASKGTGNFTRQVCKSLAYAPDRGALCVTPA